jgi:hypothetical protein
MEKEDKEYFIATKDEKSEVLVYASESFRLSEVDLINLIKICLIEARSKAIGKKILAVYRDSTEHRKQITQERLKLIGVNDNGDQKPTKPKKPTLR